MPPAELRTSQGDHTLKCVIAPVDVAVVLSIRRELIDDFADLF